MQREVQVLSTSYCNGEQKRQRNKGGLLIAWRITCTLHTVRSIQSRRGFFLPFLLWIKPEAILDPSKTDSTKDFKIDFKWDFSKTLCVVPLCGRIHCKVHPHLSSVNKREDAKEQGKIEPRRWCPSPVLTRDKGSLNRGGQMRKD